MKDLLPIWKGAGVIIDTDTHWVLQRRDNIDGINWPGKVALWGGAMELVDEGSFIKSALRELNEETGISPEDIDLVHFGSFTRDHQTIKGEPMHNKVELFVARLKKPIAIHVYEGKGTYVISRGTPIAELDTTEFAPGVSEALQELEGYDGYEQTAT